MESTLARRRPFGLDGHLAAPLTTLPRATLTLATLLLATLLLVPAPAAAQSVVSTRLTTNAFGTAVIGLIENDTDHGLEIVGLRVTLLDAIGDPVGRQAGVPDLRVLAPGDRVPFTAQSFDPPPSAPATSASVELSTRNADAPAAPLAVRDVQAEPSIAGTRVRGTVVNLGEVPLDFVKVSATALGPNDAVLATGIFYENLRTLAPGGSMPFSVLLPGFQDVAASWLVRAHDGHGAR